MAGIILGEQFAVFSPKAQLSVLSDGCYEKLSNDELAEMARYWFKIINKNTSKLANKRNIPVSVFAMSQSVMSLIRYAIDTNATHLEINQSGDIAGNDIGVWRVTAQKLSDDS